MAKYKTPRIASCIDCGDKIVRTYYHQSYLCKNCALKRIVSSAYSLHSNNGTQYKKWLVKSIVKLCTQYTVCYIKEYGNIPVITDILDDNSKITISITIDQKG
jgi:hypothetical protein